MRCRVRWRHREVAERALGVQAAPRPRPQVHGGRAVPSTSEHTRCMAVTPTLYIADNKAGVISCGSLWRTDAVDSDEETMQGEEARGEVEAETASKERVRTAVDALRVTPDGRFLVTASTSTDLRVWDLSTLTSHDQQQHNMKGKQQWHQQQQQQQQQRHAPTTTAAAGAAVAAATTTAAALLDDLFVNEAELNANMTAATMAAHPTDDSLLAIDTARGDVFVCDVANHNVLSKLKSVIKCDYSTGQHTTILHRNDRADDMAMCDHQHLLTVSSSVSRGRVALWALDLTLNRTMIPHRAV
ncbi:hypothetical protein PTSG_09681 [Salpingoeca rosetta]|uniref:Uncharacterized protein n=1 Tax=Salpingoeca rosetta (strain ATCC 50818 / BSB-021) TaxID=946362 RepID=F2ULP4_SALR5|nr:uncharacterized protein PTSG_09681 [Salpingoeca rosetta]EGD78043.1 hypothetical protein PTSG_09681 [Salpingoeca rosetta]|eukprot:XP_004990105.1 hypothetical protein PTSG_09681 [Salpingoeca rosetta]